MTRERAIEIAREAARRHRPPYYAEPFHPHEWVIDAIHEAARPRPREVLPAFVELERAVKFAVWWARVITVIVLALALDVIYLTLR